MKYLKMEQVKNIITAISQKETGFLRELLSNPIKRLTHFSDIELTEDEIAEVQEEIQELKKRGAFVIDVRTTGEYSSGHIKGSVNIPLNTLSSHLNKVPKNKPLITCCASGMRSASAKSILQSNGYTKVYNGGGWSSLQNKI